MSVSFTSVLGCFPIDTACSMSVCKELRCIKRTSSRISISQQYFHCINMVSPIWYCSQFPDLLFNQNVLHGDTTLLCFSSQRVLVTFPVCPASSNRSEPPANNFFFSVQFLVLLVTSFFSSFWILFLLLIL